jgi:acyl-CoA reductase-like NAD-dependent aldehyde dehydrogenase
MCGAATRLIVEETVYEEFVAKLVKSVSALKMGYWREDGFNKGPVISEN